MTDKMIGGSYMEKYLLWSGQDRSPKPGYFNPMFLSEKKGQRGEACDSQ